MKPYHIRFSEKDFLHANRRAARQEDIDEHGRPTAFRSAKHATMKQYNRQKERREAFNNYDY